MRRSGFLAVVATLVSKYPDSQGKTLRRTELAEPLACSEWNRIEPAVYGNKPFTKFLSEKELVK